MPKIYPVGSKKRSKMDLAVKACLALVAAGIVGMLADEHAGTPDHAEGVVVDYTFGKNRKMIILIESGPHQGKTVRVPYGFFRASDKIEENVQVEVDFKKAKWSDNLYGVAARPAPSPKP